MIRTYTAILIMLSFLTAAVSGDLVAHWDFDQASGTVEYDTIGAKAATLMGGTTFSGSGYANLDGSNDYINFAIGDIINSLQSCTFIIDVDFPGDGGTWQRIFSIGNSTSEFFNLAYTNLADDQLLLKKRVNAHDEVSYIDAKGNFRGRHTYAVVIDSQTKITSVYIDGCLLSKTIENDFTPSLLGNTTNNWIGKSQYSTGRYLKAKIHDFKIYNNTLNDQQVSLASGFKGTITPLPADKSLAVSTAPVLRWSPTGNANLYRVFLSTDEAQVDSANTNSECFLATPTTNIYQTEQLNLKENTKYFWRVDQYDEASSQFVKGWTWSFRTGLKGEKITLMSFNIKCDYGWPSFSDEDAWVYYGGDDRRDRVIDMIKTQSSAFGSDAPDIIGMQEALSNQVQDIDSALTDYDYYGVGRDDGQSGSEFCCIFYKSTKYDKLDSGTFWLSTTPDVPGSVYDGAYCTRIASWVKLKRKNTPFEFIVLNTHWDHVSQPARSYSAQLIRDKIPQIAGDLPFVIMGDMNANEDSTEYKTLLGYYVQAQHRYIDTFRSVYPVRHSDELSCHGWKGGTYGSRIDFIMCSNDMVVENATFERSRVNDRFPSDHYPATATVQIPRKLTADFSNDFKVDLDDLSIFLNYWLDSDTWIYPVQPSDNSLVYHLDFDGPQTASTLTDSVQGLQAQLINGASLNGLGQVDLAPQQQQYVDMGLAAGDIVETLNSYTIAADITWLGNEFGTWQKIWNFSQQGIDQFAMLTLVSTNEEYLRCQHRFNGHDEKANAATPNLLGRHHIAVVYDSQAGEFGVFRIYVDGIQRGYRTALCDMSLSLIGKTVNNWLGKSPYTDASYFYGQIDDFRIYNTALSGENIAYLISETLPVKHAMDERVNLNTSAGDEAEKIDLNDFSVFADQWNKTE